MNLIFHRWARRLGALIGAFAALPALGDIHPGNYYQSEMLSFDRSAPPADHYVWRRMIHGWHEQPVPHSSYTTMHFVCLSNTDPATGQCRTTTGGRHGTTDILLRFTERRSGLSVVLTVKGNITRRHPLNSPCGTWGTATWMLTSTSSDNCEGIPVTGTASTLWIPRSELAKLPAGGIWTAQLVMKLRRFYSQPIGDAHIYTVDFKLDVTDHNNVQIYLPAHGISTPQVDLNLRTRPLINGPGGIVSGQAVVDACLYDGYNSNSQRFEMRVTDKNPVPGMAGRFFVKHTSGGTDERNRIEYRVRTRTANLGETQHVSGQPVTFTGINNADIRAVRLPNVPFPVVCTPWPITLETPQFRQIDKNTGQYRGELNLEFTPSTSSP